MPGARSIELGIFILPGAEHAQRTVDACLAAEAAGLDLVAIQDHPYQRRYLDTWTLLSYVAGRAERIGLVTDVVNLPLRLPSVLAKSAASLDVLSGGRVELGIGAGTFWEAVEAMGGPKRTPKQSVDALEEAIAIIRGFWSGERSVTVEGEHYRVTGAKPGPSPAHPIGLWIGAYGPRMLRITGRLGDGWLPSLGGRYLSPDQIPAMQARIDDAAKRAGREPREVRRIVNLMVLDDVPGAWPAELGRVVALGFEKILVGVPDDGAIDFVRRLGEEVAPRLREALDEAAGPPG